MAELHKGEYASVILFRDSENEAVFNALFNTGLTFRIDYNKELELNELEIYTNVNPRGRFTRIDHEEYEFVLKSINNG